MAPELQALANKCKQLQSSGIYEEWVECRDEVERQLDERHGSDYRFFVDLTLEERVLLLEVQGEIDDTDVHLKDVYIVVEEGKVRLAPKSEKWRSDVWRGDVLVLCYYDFDDHDCSAAEFFLEVYNTLVRCAKCDPEKTQSVLLQIREYHASTSFTYCPLKPEARERNRRERAAAEPVSA